jgi:hypothetical protein
MEKNLCLTILIILTILPLVSAANLGISPAKIAFENTLRGGYAEGSVSIVIDSEKPMSVNVEPVGDIASWINLSQTNFTVSKDTPQSLKVILNVPNDAANGNYTGYVRVKIHSFEEAQDGYMMGKIHSNLDLKTTIEVTDKEIIDCSVSMLQIPNSEKGDDVVLRMDIKNNGNVRISPEIIANIWDSSQSSIMQIDKFTSKEILPTVKESLNFRIKSDDLPIDQYWADIQVPKCEYSGLKTFDILEEGSLNTKGVLLSIVANLNGKVGEISPVEVGFKNIGEKDVQAKFVGKVSRNGKVTKILESEEITVLRSEIEKFNLYFTPAEAGEYVVSGRVIYDGKRTYEKSITITASKKSFNSISLVYYAFIVLISFLLYKIRKEKKHYKNKMRRLK